ncbi:MAG: RNA-binding S4 domain-containing protein [Pseudomonadota bacterium]
MSEPRPSLRIDKWLWYARFFKTRGLAAKVAAGGHCRVNGEHVAKASFGVGPGDTITFPQGRQVRVVEILEIGSRRGPAPEAQSLYLDISPPPPPKPTVVPGSDRSGRPTKSDRRAIEKLKHRGGQT